MQRNKISNNSYPSTGMPQVCSWIQQSIYDDIDAVFGSLGHVTILRYFLWDTGSNKQQPQGRVYISDPLYVDKKQINKLAKQIMYIRVLSVRSVTISDIYKEYLDGPLPK